MNLYLRPNTGRQLACVEIEGRVTQDLSWTKFQPGVDFCVRTGKDPHSGRRKSFLLVRIDTFAPQLQQEICIEREALGGWKDGDGSFVPVILRVRRENLLTRDWVLVVDFGNSRTSVVAICNPTDDPRPFQLLSLIDADLPRLDFTGEGEIQGDYLTRSFILFDRAEEGLVTDAQGQQAPGKKFKCYIGEMARQLSVDYVVPSSSICYSPKRQLWDQEAPQEPHFLTSVGAEPVLDPIAGGFLRNCHVAAYYLEELFRASNQALNRISGEDDNVINTVRRIVFAVPAAFSMAEREGLQRCAQWAAQAAGLGSHLASDDATFVISDEANAAATYFLKTTYEACSHEERNYDGGDPLSGTTAGHKFSRVLAKYGRGKGKKDTLTVMLVDIGAGTTDVAVNQYRWIKEELAIGRQVKQIDSFILGGDNVSEELIRLLADHVSGLVELPRHKLTCNFKSTRNAGDLVRRLLFERFNSYAEQIKIISTSRRGRLSREWLELRFDDLILGTTFPQYVDPFDYLSHGTLFRNGLFYEKDSLNPRRVIVEANLMQDMVNSALAKHPRELRHLRMLADRLSPDVVILAGMSSRLPGVSSIFEREIEGKSHRVVALSSLYPSENEGMQHIATPEIIACGFDKLAVVLGAAILAAGKYYDERPRIINEKEEHAVPGSLAGAGGAELDSLFDEQEGDTSIRGFFPQPRFIAIPAGKCDLEFDPSMSFNPQIGFDKQQGHGDFFLPWNAGNMLSCSSSFCDPRKFPFSPATMIANITYSRGEFRGMIKLRVQRERPGEVTIVGAGRDKLNMREPGDNEFVIRHQRTNDIHFSNHGVHISPGKEVNQ